MTLINEDNLNISAEQIAQEGLNALDSKYQKSVGFFAWDYFVSIGKIVYKVWDKVIYIAKCLIDLSNMNYDDLVKFIWNTRGIEAKSETASSGLLKLTYGNGTIREGDIFETSSGVQFRATETSVVSENGYFKVECMTIKTFLDEVKFCELEPTETSYFISFSKLASKVALAEGIEDLDIDTFKVNDSQENIIILDNNNKTQIAEIGTIQITELNE